MARLERRHDARADRGGGHAFLVRQIDLHDSVAVVELERARRRDVGSVVEVDAEKLSLRFENADDAKLQAADAHACAQRIVGTEQFLLELGAEDDEGTRIVGVLGGQELAAAHPDAEHLEHLGADPVHGGPAQAAIGIDLGVAPDGGGHAGDMRQMLERARVVERQRPYRGRDAGRRVT